jgi:hypothetical protein
VGSGPIARVAPVERVGHVAGADRVADGRCLETNLVNPIDKRVPAARPFAASGRVVRPRESASRITFPSRGTVASPVLRRRIDVVAARNGGSSRCLSSRRDDVDASAKRTKNRLPCGLLAYEMTRAAQRRPRARGAWLVRTNSLSAERPRFARLPGSPGSCRQPRLPAAVAREREPAAHARVQFRFSNETSRATVGAGGWFKEAGGGL